MGLVRSFRHADCSTSLHKRQGIIKVPQEREAFEFLCVATLEDQGRVSDLRDNRVSLLFSRSGELAALFWGLEYLDRSLM